MKTKWRIEKCKCGDPACDRYYIPGIVEGQGILTKEHAELIVRSVNSLPELVRNAKAVLARFDEGKVIINPKIPNYAYSLTVHGCQVDMQSLREALAAAGVKP